jgi:hypothetical protein
VSGIDLGQLRQYVIVPTLDYLGAQRFGGPAAEEILIGIALQESRGGHYLAQLFPGPARGLWEMEPATEQDIWENFLRYKTDLFAAVWGLLGPRLDRGMQLYGNLYYACAMARIELYRAPEKLPDAGDVAAQADFYKRHYNSGRGKATVAEYLANWRAAFPPATQKDQA